MWREKKIKPRRNVLVAPSAKLFLLLVFCSFLVFLVVVCRLVVNIFLNLEKRCCKLNKLKRYFVKELLEVSRNWFCNEKIGHSDGDVTKEGFKYLFTHSHSNLFMFMQSCLGHPIKKLIKAIKFVTSPIDIQFGKVSILKSEKLKSEFNQLRST